MGWVTEFAGRKLARFLTKPVWQSSQVATATQEQLAAALRPADVLLVEGNTRVSVAIKYLTQSTCVARRAISISRHFSSSSSRQSKSASTTAH